jgi:tetratricopeptide (TPR) repeat protein
MKGRTDLTSYLLGERSELRSLIEAIAEAADDRHRERAAVEYLLVLASARQAARGEATEERTLAQVRAQYCRVFGPDDSEHGRFLRELHTSLESGSARAVATALILLGLYHRKQGAFERARASFAVSAELAKRQSDPIEQLNALFWLGVVERYLGNLEAAEQVHREQLEKARQAGSGAQAVLAQENLGLVALRRGQVAEARSRVTKALAEATDLGDPELEGYCYHALLVVETTVGRPGEAAACGWEAYRRYESTDQRMRALQDCGVILYQCGLMKAARAAFEIVLNGSGDATSRINARTGLADVAAALGDRTGFETLTRDLLTERSLATLPYELRSVYRTAGLGYALFGELNKASKYLEMSLAIAEDRNFSAEAAEARELLTNLPRSVPARGTVQTSGTEYERLEDVGRSIVAERALVCA